MFSNKLCTKKLFLGVCIFVPLFVASTICVLLTVKNTNDKGIVEIGKQKEETSIKRLYFMLPMNEKKFKKFQVSIENRKDIWYKKS